MVSITTLTTTTIFSLLLFSIFTNPSLSDSSNQNLKISVTPKTIRKSGDSVTIRWTGFESPSKLDWLGIYSPPNSTHKNFIGYLFLSSSPGFQTGSGSGSEPGSGSFTIPLINLRAGYQFRIFHWPESEVNQKHQDHDRNPLPGTKHLLAESEVIGFEPGRGPEQVHLALTGKAGEMRVMFVTHDGRESFVKYGLTREGLGRVGNSKVSRYGREDLCHAPANESIGWRDPGYIHDALMVDLKKGTKYYYKVGSDSGGWSMPYSFVSHDEDSSEAVAFLFGDMGTATPYKTFIRTQDESISTIKWITRDMEALGDKPVFISHIGDISYARGYSWIWDNFFNQIEPIASKAPYHVCIGNHEYNWLAQPWRPDWAVPIFGKDGGGECGVPYSLRFNMPGDSSEPTGSRSPDTRNLYYSVDVGPVHFVYMSTETNFLSGSKQYEFLKHDLESVDRKKTPFVVVQGHRPMYTTSSGDRDAPHTERMREHLEPLFVKNKVSLALWAHVHRYERFCPLNNNTCGNVDMDGGRVEPFPVHIVIGMGGQDWQATWQPRKEHPDLPIYPQPSQSLFRGGIFGYTRLEASKEKLIFSYIGNHDGQVHDKVEIHASGLVISGDSSIADSRGTKEGDKVESNLSLYITSVIVLLVGALIGYIIGFKSHASHNATPGWRWTRVGNEEL